MLRALLFDFDGTLADTEPLHLESFRRVLGPLGVTIRDDEYETRYLVGTDRECLERMIVDYNRPDLAPHIERLWHEKREAMDGLLAEAQLFPGAADFVERAHAVGPLAIVTGGLRDPVRRVLERLDLLKSFPVFVSAEDVAHGKPNPEGYRLAWARLRDQQLADLQATECLALEDSPNGVAAARAAGMRTLAFTHSTSPHALATADFVVPGYAAIDLAAILTRFQ